MKVSTIKHVTIVVELNEDEATFLLGYLQNWPEECFGKETAEGQSIRANLFSNLRRCLQPES